MSNSKLFPNNLQDSAEIGSEEVQQAAEGKPAQTTFVRAAGQGLDNPNDTQAVVKGSDDE